MRYALIYTRAMHEPPNLIFSIWILSRVLCANKFTVFYLSLGLAERSTKTIERAARVKFCVAKRI